MEVWSRRQGAFSRRNTHRQNQTWKWRLNRRTLFSVLPGLKGLEEQEEEELFPLLPVFLLRWP